MVEKAEKTTIMILKVDLQCSRCYKKVKKVLCKFPQIRDQRYDEKENKVFISVVCCDPERFRDKLCSKGCGVIKSIEIVEPPKPKPPTPEKPRPPSPEKPKEPKPLPEKPKEPKKLDPPPENPPKPKDPSPPPPPKKPEPEPVTVMPCYPVYPPPTGFCCGPCSEGISGGPCYGWFDRPPPPPPPPPRPCYEPFYGCRCGQPRGYYGCRCDYNYSYCQDNSSCTIM